MSELFFYILGIITGIKIILLFIFWREIREKMFDYYYDLRYYMIKRGWIKR